MVPRANRLRQEESILRSLSKIPLAQSSSLDCVKMANKFLVVPDTLLQKIADRGRKGRVGKDLAIRHGFGARSFPQRTIGIAHLHSSVTAHVQVAKTELCTLEGSMLANPFKVDNGLFDEEHRVLQVGRTA